MKSKSLASVNYQNVMRAIGQGLETFKVKSFVLEVSESHYVVRGAGKKPMTPDLPKMSIKNAFLAPVVSVTKNRPVQSAGSTPFHFTGLRFTATDIELLERKGKVIRTKFPDTAPDPHRLSQILRTVGAYLDQDGCQLVQMSWRDGFLRLWYINRRGFESKDILSPLALYDWWVHQYKRRRPLGLLKRTGSD